jgi:hypothetical protein
MMTRSLLRRTPTTYDGTHAYSGHILAQNPSQAQDFRFSRYPNAANVAQDGFGGSVDYNASIEGAYLSTEQYVTPACS